MTVALSWRIGLYYYAVWHGYWDLQLFLHSTEKVGTSYLVVRISQLRLPIGVK